MPKLVSIMSELVKRTLSGAAYVAVIIGSILYDNGWIWGLISVFLAYFAVREFNRLTHPKCLIDNYSQLSGAILVYLFASHFLIHGDFTYSSFAICVLFIVCIMLCVLLELWDKNGNPLANWGNFALGQMLVALPFALMNILCGMDKYLLLAVFVLIWVNDSFAYLVGVSTAKLPKGNHKMFPRVSPKKSWEGLFGGIVFSLIAGALLAHYGWFSAVQTPMNTYLLGMLFALFVSVFGTFGDLVESLIKRTVGVKDSGRFLPGHGGILDRFDSMLLATPMSLALIFIIEQCSKAL